MPRIVTSFLVQITQAWQSLTNAQILAWNATANTAPGRHPLRCHQPETRHPGIRASPVPIARLLPSLTRTHRRPPPSTSRAPTTTPPLVRSLKMFSWRASCPRKKTRVLLWKQSVLISSLCRFAPLRNSFFCVDYHHACKSIKLNHYICTWIVRKHLITQ